MTKIGTISIFKEKLFIVFLFIDLLELIISILHHYLSFQYIFFTINKLILRFLSNYIV